MSEASDNIAVLQQQLGPQWPGAESEGRAAMVRVLQKAHGCDKAEAEALIAALERAGKICYHLYGNAQREEMAAQGVPIGTTDNLGRWGVERRLRQLATAKAGYWKIGHHQENSLGRAGQIDPTG